MGADQSKNSKQAQQPTNVYSKSDVDILLEKQRRLYEARCKELAAKTAAQVQAAKTAAEVQAIKTAAQVQSVKTAAQVQAAKTAAQVQAVKMAAQVQAVKTAAQVQATNFPQSPPLVQRSIFEHHPLEGSNYQRQSQSLVSEPSTAGSTLYPTLNNLTRNTIQTPDVRVTAIQDVPLVQRTPRPQPSAPLAPDFPQKEYSRPRSLSRPRSQNGEEPKCVTCKKKFTLQIFQCEKGHSSCLNCRARGASCGICFMRITKMRNFTLETYVSEMILPCPNSKDGCNLSFKLAEVDEHLKECLFRDTTCPTATIFRRNCNWIGKISQMVEHFNDCHQENRFGEVNKEMFIYNLDNNLIQMHLVELGFYKFLVIVKVSNTERKIYMTVQILGTKVTAAKWTYEFHVYNKRMPRRKYQYKDVCHSSSVPLKDIFEGSHSAIIPLAYATTFVNEGALIYKFFIKKEFDNKKVYPKNQRRYGPSRSQPN